MPFEYVKDDVRKRVMVTVTDPFTVDDIKASVTRQAEDGAWHYGALIDARTVQNPPSSNNITALLTAVQGLAAVHGPRGPVAMVTVAKVMRGTAREYSLRGETVALQIEVFGDIGAAERWLDERARIDKETEKSG